MVERERERETVQLLPEHTDSLRELLHKVSSSAVSDHNSVLR